MKKVFKIIGKVLDELLCFVPDFFLVLSISSLFLNGTEFDEYRNLIAVCFFITYLGTNYGERMYHKIKVARELMFDEVIPSIDGLQKSYSDFVTKEELLAFADVVDNIIDEKISESRVMFVKDITKGVASSVEVDTKEYY